MFKLYEGDRMQIKSEFLSVWKQLQQGGISCEQALKLLCDQQGSLHIDRLDEDVCNRFFKACAGHKLPPIVPLLLWRNCFYLGSPETLSDPEIQALRDRTLTEIRIISITPKSYRIWHHARSVDLSCIHGYVLIDPLTGERSQEDIGETTELFLSKAEGQVERIKAIISSALRHRASDIHLEPTQEGLRVRYRIDGVLRDITTLPQPPRRQNWRTIPPGR